jgi:hypothetical protein
MVGGEDNGSVERWRPEPGGSAEDSRSPGRSTGAHAQLVAGRTLTERAPREAKEREHE